MTDQSHARFTDIIDASSVTVLLYDYRPGCDNTNHKNALKSHHQRESVSICAATLNRHRKLNFSSGSYLEKTMWRRQASVLIVIFVVAVGFFYETDANVVERFKRSASGCVSSPDVICCNGTMHLKRGNTVCCGSEAYDPSFFRTCCNGTVGFGSACCGSKAYDPSFRMCCNGTVTRGLGSVCCGNNAYDPSYSKCCNGTVGFGSACCGSKAYNPSFSKCCNGIVTMGFKLTCCGNKAYNPSFSQCCNGTVGDGSACCGNEAYYPFRSTCCNGKLQPKKFFGPSC